jgi:hypothetical protein
MDSRPWVLLLALIAMVGVLVWAGQEGVSQSQDIVRGLFSLLSLRLSTSIAAAMVAGAFSMRASRSLAATVRRSRQSGQLDERDKVS